MGRLDLLRLSIRRFAIAAGASSDRVDEFVFAVNEVATNALLHGAGRRRLALWAQSGRLVCAVLDEGRFAKEDLSEGSPRDGHGLWLAEQFADGLLIRSGDDGTEVFLMLDCRGRSAL